MAVFAFDDLIEAITHAVIRAKWLAEQQYLHLVPGEGEENTYFARNGETGELSAKTIDVAVFPAGSETGIQESVQVPLISMIPQKSLQVSDLTFEFQAYVAHLDRTDPKKAAGKSRKKNLYLSLKKSWFRKRRQVNIKITLKSGDPPEGQILINDELLRQI